MHSSQSEKEGQITNKSGIRSRISEHVDIRVSQLALQILSCLGCIKLSTLERMGVPFFFPQHRCPLGMINPEVPNIEKGGLQRMTADKSEKGKKDTCVPWRVLSISVHQIIASTF